MTFNFDTSELTQTAARRITPHDNCIVTEVGSGAFPRYIKVQLPDDDGPQQVALWDGSLDLEVNDEVYCHEYAEVPVWRVMAMGGNDSGAGKQRVSKVWESDFGAVALQADATGQIEVGKLTGPDAKFEVLDTGGAQLRLTFEDGVKFADFTLDTNHDLTIDPSSTGLIKLAADVTVTNLVSHEGDPDTELAFTDDDVEITVGGLSMLKLTEAGQDIVGIGDVAGGGDVDIRFNNDQMFLEGSSGNVGIGTTSPSNLLDVSGINIVAIFGNGNDNAQIRLDGAIGKSRDISFLSGGSLRWVLRTNSIAESGGDVGSNFVFVSRTDAGAFKADVITIERNGNVGIGIASPAAQLHTTQGRIKGTTRITNASSPYTVLVTDHIILADTDSGAIIVNLPAGVGGTHYRITNTGTAANDVTIDPNGSEQLFGGGAGASFALIDAETINIYFETTEGWW